MRNVAGGRCSTARCQHRGVTAAGPSSQHSPISLRELDALGVERLKGVGGKKRDGLAVLGIHSVLDLLFHYPRRYVDRTREARIADLAPGEEGMFVGEVQSISSRRVRGGRAMVEARVTDGSGTMKVTFFNQGWRERQLPIGTRAVFYGKVDEFRGARQLTNPVVDLVGDRTGRILPIYPQSEKAKLSTWELADWVAESLRRIAPRGLADPVPVTVLDAHDLIGRQDAMAAIHAPESMGHMTKARSRLVFDELLRVQLALVAAKAEREATVTGVVHAVDSGPPRQSLPSWSTASSPGCHSPSPAPRRGRSTRSWRTSSVARPCTACFRATSARARHWWRWQRCWPQCRADTRGR